MKIIIKRGLKERLPLLNVGEFGLCEDTEEVFIGTPTGNKQLLDSNAEVSIYDAIAELEGATNTALDDKAPYLYVNDKVAELNQSISNIGNGSPKGAYATLTALQTAHPTGATGTYIVSADNKWYYWNGTAWTAGGDYQTAVLGDKTVHRNNLDDELLSMTEEEWPAGGEEHIYYAIVDTSGRRVFSIDENGTTTIYKMNFTAKSIPESSLEGTEVTDETASGVLWGVVDSSMRISELNINEQGQVPQWVLDAWKERMNVAENDAEVQDATFWGDSMTAGAGGNGTSYPSVFATLSGKVVNNMGVGGETSATIACRQGGRTFMVNNFTIPADTTKVKVAGYDNDLTDNFGRVVKPLRQGSAGINPCYIKGVKGTLSIVQSSSTANDYEYFFQRTDAGTAVVVDRPTPIICDAHLSKKRRDIISIFIGQNGGFTDDEELINQIKSMIDFNNAVNTEYVVCGLTSGTATSKAAQESALQQAFGRRFINLREYLSTYGLADAGITPTAQDLADMESGATPVSLRVDGVHLNAAGYTVVGNLVYNRMKELGIL